MSDFSQQSAIELANIYARYFVSDFTTNVMRHLGGSYPVPTPELQKFIAEKTESLLNASDVTIGSTNTINRFIFECAQHVIEQDFDDKIALETWQTVSALPSIHHNEIQTLVYESARVYRNTVQNTLLNVVAKDAHVAAQSIVQAAQARTNSQETGGNVHLFSWGILNDGLWLNGALLKARELASVFRAGEPVAAHYAQTAFDFARQHSPTARIDNDNLIIYQAEVDMLLSQSHDDSVAELLTTISQSDLNDILFSAGVLSDHTVAWERGMRDMNQLIWSVTRLSTLARLVQTLSDSYRQLEDKTMVSDTTVHRMNQVHNVVCLALAGYEALRETKFTDALIMHVTAEGDDPKVDVVVNGDLINKYHASGYDDADLVYFGLHLDPRKGMPASNTGWSMQYVMQRRDQVIPQIMSEEASRLERLRNNDASVIQDITIGTVTEVVNSYLQARGHDVMSPAIFQSVNRLARKVTDANSDINLDSEITKILVATMDDPFVTSVSDRLVHHLTATEQTSQSYAPALTIAETAIVDAVSYISDGPNQ